jgi:hypothetical protein
MTFPLCSGHKTYRCEGDKISQNRRFEYNRGSWNLVLCRKLLSNFLHNTTPVPKEPYNQAAGAVSQSVSERVQPALDKIRLF